MHRCQYTQRGFSSLCKHAYQYRDRPQALRDGFPCWLNSQKIIAGDRCQPSVGHDASRDQVPKSLFLRSHVGVIFGFVYSCWCHVQIYVFIWVSSFDWCIHAGVIFGLVYLCWCHLGMCVSILVSCVDLCIHVGAIVECMYSCWCICWICLFML